MPACRWMKHPVVSSPVTNKGTIGLNHEWVMGNGGCPWVSFTSVANVALVGAAPINNHPPLLFPFGWEYLSRIYFEICYFCCCRCFVFIISPEPFRKNRPKHFIEQTSKFLCLCVWESVCVSLCAIQINTHTYIGMNIYYGGVCMCGLGVYVWVYNTVSILFSKLKSITGAAPSAVFCMKYYNYERWDPGVA